MSISEQLRPSTASVPTPCIGVCDLDQKSGLCKGCARSGEEVGAWSEADADYKQRVWDELAARRAGLAMAAYRLPWSAEDIGAMIERTLRRRWGRWAFGVGGVSVAFEIGADEDAEIVSRPDMLMAITQRGAIRLIKHHKTIAVAFGNTADPCGPEAIGLVLPRGRVDLRKGEGLANIGPDSAAIAAHRDARLYDLGLGDDIAARFCLRTNDSMLIDSLGQHEGETWRQAGEAVAPAIQTAQPHFIVETGLGRIETFEPPSLGGVRPDFQNSNDSVTELPAGWTLPPVFAPCALFYPHSRKRAEALLDGHF